jgi:8-oxo-dGTP diphosphatase
VIVEDGHVALVRRVRAGRTYYVFPGGGVHAGETPEQAAAREALEELGVRVRVGELLHIEVFDGERFLYFSAEIVGGEFGTGRGDEIGASGTTDAGTYEPVWLPLSELASVPDGLDVRPPRLAEYLSSAAGRPNK